MAPLRILIVDDDADNRDTLGLLCKMSGHEVRTAADGLQATQLARTWEPDAVVLDMEMPVMDGFTAAHELRCECEHAVIVGVSGRPDRDTATRACAAGCDAYFQKPVDFDTLSGAFERDGSAGQR